MKILRFSRRPFYVDAVRVSNNNIAEVAEWCGGELVENDPESGEGGSKFVRVPTRPGTEEKHGRARSGDWVLKAEDGQFRVYGNRGFRAAFEDVPAKKDPDELDGRNQSFEVFNE